jgi:hypothetical protein
MDVHPVPPLLYHFTDAPGLRGIVESHALWATHIYYLNDAQEFGYAEDLAGRLILERAEQSAAPREHALLTRLGTDLSVEGEIKGIVGLPRVLKKIFRLALDRVFTHQIILL